MCITSKSVVIGSASQEVCSVRFQPYSEYHFAFGCVLLLWVKTWYHVLGNSFDSVDFKLTVTVHSTITCAVHVATIIIVHMNQSCILISLLFLAMQSLNYTLSWIKWATTTMTCPNCTTRAC